MESLGGRMYYIWKLLSSIMKHELIVASIMESIFGGGEEIQVICEWR